MGDWLSEIEAKIRDEAWPTTVAEARMARVLRELAGVVKHVANFEPGEAMIALRDLSDDAMEIVKEERRKR